MFVLLLVLQGVYRFMFVEVPNHGRGGGRGGGE